MRHSGDHVGDETAAFSGVGGSNPPVQAATGEAEGKEEHKAAYFLTTSPSAASSEPSELASLSRIPGTESVASEDQGQTDEQTKKQASNDRGRAVAVVSPKGKAARKEKGAQQRDKGSASSSPTPATLRLAAYKSPTRKAWSEKEDARQQKSAVPRLARENEKVAPGWFAVVPNLDEEDIRMSVSNGSGQQQRNESTTIAASSNKHRPLSEKQLVEATLVDSVFAEAALVDEEAGETEDGPAVRKRRFSIFVSLNLLLGIIGLVLLLYFLLRREEGGAASGSPTLAPSTAFPTTLSPTVENAFGLPTTTWERILADPDSPQSRAWQWLLDDIEYNDREKYEDWQIKQRFALVVLNLATNSTGSWKEGKFWLAHGENECLWYTTATSNYPCKNAEDDDDGKVNSTVMERQYTVLHLNDTGLKGSLPPEVFELLPALRAVQIGYNKDLVGAFPTEVGLLTSLTNLHIQENQFSAGLPSQMGLLTILRKLHAHENQFSGLMPVEVGNMSALQDLRLHFNRLTGPIPSQVGLLTELQFVILEENNLKSSIPSMLGELSNVKRLRINDNQLSGSIPSQLGTMSKVLTIALQRNRLTGSIPKQLGYPSKLEGLLLHENAGLTGSIPKELFNRTMLSFKRLLLYNTKLTGTIPSQIGLLEALEDCWIHSNYLSGSIPTEVGNMTALLSLSISDTLLSGSIPQQLGLLTLMTDCALHSNPLLSGSIPSTIGGLTSVKFLSVNSTNLTGLVPS